VAYKQGSRQLMSKLITQHTRLVKPVMTGLEKQQNVLATISNASGAYLEPILGGSVCRLTDYVESAC
jgi:hypothetical protein